MLLLLFFFNCLFLGAWNADGKSESLWDRYIHTTPGFIEDGSTGDVACNSYYLWENDIAILKEMGANHYRFSIAWTRILPTGEENIFGIELSISVI